MSSPVKVVGRCLPRNCQTLTPFVPAQNGGVTEGFGSPVAPPANINVAWIYTDLSTGQIWTWNKYQKLWG